MAVNYSKGSASWKKFSAAFSDALGDVNEQLTNFGKRIVTECCEEWIRDIDSEWPHSTSLSNGARFGGDHFHPWYSGQLHDSVAVRISQRNRTIAVRYMPTKAEFAQKDDKNRRVVGIDCAIDEIRNAQYVFLPGIQMQIIVGVPYARKVNESERHSGYLENMRADFFSKIEDRLEEVFEGNENNRGRIFVPKKYKKR